MDLEQYLKELVENTNTTLKLVENYTQNELTSRKEQECSISDLLEHICISDERTIALLKSNSERTSVTQELYGKEKLKKIVVDYKGGPKITETEIKELKGSVTDYAIFNQIFSQQRNNLYNQLASGEIAISKNIHNHLYLKEMTVTDWLHYLIYHTDRHINDIKDSVLAFKRS